MQAKQQVWSLGFWFRSGCDLVCFVLFFFGREGGGRGSSVSGKGSEALGCCSRCWGVIRVPVFGYSIGPQELQFRAFPLDLVGSWRTSGSFGVS